MKKLLLLLILCFGSLQAQVGPPPPPCSPPTAIAITYEQNGNLIDWPAVSGTSAWHVFMLPVGSPAPTDEEEGLLLTGNGFAVSGLPCGQVYDFYLRAADCGGPAILGGPYPFSTKSCFEGAGTPENLVACPADGVICFDLQPNTDSILGTLDPAQFTVAYYATYAQAIAETAALASPACFAGPSQYLYARIDKNDTAEFYILVFNLRSGGTECPGLALNAFFDSNGDGIQNAGEISTISSFYHLGHFEYEVNNDGNVQTVAASNGQHTIFDANFGNSYTLDFVFNPEYAAYYTAPSFTDVHTSGSGVTTYNFPISATDPYHDVGVLLYSLGNPRPGFVYRQYINYTNSGNMTEASGTIAFTKDAALSVVSVSQPVTFTDDGFTFNFTDLDPFETKSILVEMHVPVIPTVSLGQLVTNSVSVTVPADLVPENNTASVTKTIVGSYDPNDKAEAHGKEILITDFTPEDYLYYTIRFENTGTASAESVRVTDVLDAQLDETSVRMLGSSLDGTMSRSGNVLTWVFTNIDLPPASADPVRSQGFINFKVKPRPGFAVGDVIPNAASIYFDFNPAIVTEPFETHFVDILSTAGFDSAHALVFPNPANDKITVALDKGSIARIAITDISGKKVLVQTGNSPSETVDIARLSAGMYFVEITNDSNTKAVQKLIVR